MKICNFIMFFAVWLFSFQVYSAELDIELDKNIMVEGDILYLTISYNGDSKNNPDLSPLSTDFRVVSNSVSSSINIINGSFSQSKKWEVGLTPLKTGKIKIKPIKLDKLISNYAEVEVKPVSDVAFVADSQTNSNSPYFKIEQNVDNKTPYIKQQVILTVTLYDSLGLEDGALKFDEASAKNWSIIPLSNKPTTQKKIINGKKMNLRKFFFAIFPQKSGNIPLPQAVFDGYYVKNISLQDPFFNRNAHMFGISLSEMVGEREAVKMRSPRQEINIKNIPNGEDISEWLPLSNLSLQYNKRNQSDFNVGDAISKKIILKAYGLQEGNFPNIEFPDIDGLKKYPEKPSFSQTVEGKDIVTTAELNVVYIPSKSGSFTFPELQINWFDVNQNIMNKTTIPEEIIEVIGNDLDASENNILEKEILPKQNPVVKQIPESKSIKNIKIEKNIKTILFKPFVAYSLILGFFLLIFIKRNNKKHRLRNCVVTYIKKHDYQNAKFSLIEWAKDKFKSDDIKNFNDIAMLAKNESFTKQLKYLNKLIYSTSDDIFNVNEFIIIFKKVDEMKINSDKKETILPNLYD